MRHGVGRCVEENLKVPMIVSGMVEWMKQQKKTICSCVVDLDGFKNTFGNMFLSKGAEESGREVGRGMAQYGVWVL